MTKIKYFPSKIESSTDEINRYFAMTEELDNDASIKTTRKKLLVLKFIQGPLIQGQPREIPLTGEKQLIFGAKEHIGKDVNSFLMHGERIADRHFEIVFDNNTIIMRNLNLNSWESCGVYRKLYD